MWSTGRWSKTLGGRGEGQGTREGWACGQKLLGECCCGQEFP